MVEGVATVGEYYGIQRGLEETQFVPNVRNKESKRGTAGESTHAAPGEGNGRYPRDEAERVGLGRENL